MNSSLLQLAVACAAAVLLASCGKQYEEASPSRMNVAETVFAPGVLMAEGLYNLTVETSGYISALAIKEGQVVGLNDTLLTIQNDQNLINASGSRNLLGFAERETLNSAPRIQQAQANVELTGQQLDFDLANLERYQQLFQSGSVARIDLEQKELAYHQSQSNYESAVQDLQRIKDDAEQQLINSQMSSDIYAQQYASNALRSLTNGKVYDLFKEQGDYVRVGDAVAQIGHATLLYAELNIDESSISKITPGQPAYIQLNVDTSKVYQGYVEEVLPSFDESSQSYICKVYFTDELSFDLINTPLEANIIVKRTENALVVPREFVDYGGFVQRKGSKEKTKVTANFISTEWVEILDGIEESDVLIREVYEE